MKTFSEIPPPMNMDKRNELMAIDLFDKMFNTNIKTTDDIDKQFFITKPEYLLYEKHHKTLKYFAWYFGWDFCFAEDKNSNNFITFFEKKE